MDAAKPITSLSVGATLREALLEDEGVKAITSKAYPVATYDANLPYIVYRLASLSQDGNKAMRLADIATLELACYAESYEQSLELAEATRAALDGKYIIGESLKISVCNLEDAEAHWEADAYCHTLVFKAKINR